ncbi:hypothetical protein [Parapedobacter sp. 10938]|uniref:hypothetical protein n=1 Tax=Parapedobacter flavus TaxID=3110225 RepID=UPI002DBFB196|nr:hypothetical protein [Parapedobacter sp. 10938]MEC3880604.1 hypothetical protein [Parapedobacter sp. 10938]
MYDCIIVENEPQSIAMMKDCISSRTDLRLVGVAKELEQFRLLLTDVTPDIIFLDFVIPPGIARGFHYGMLPKGSSIVVISAIPLHLYADAHLLHSPYELPKPVSLNMFNQCIQQIITARNER